ncbi:MAG: hypothetical protein EBU90_05295 [Proteobacteria bacterium]|nr:hypothetical protein [Pseudomonadota bacterium]NBP15713.1 hypothetical protein [bacterium]
MKQRSFLALLVMFGYSQVQAVNSNGSVIFAALLTVAPSINDQQKEQKRQERKRAFEKAIQARKTEQEAQQRIKHQNMYPKNQQKAFVGPSDPKCNKQVRKDTPPNRQRNRNSPRTSTAKGYGAKR